MKPDILADNVYIPADTVVAREIEGELIIVPLDGGIADFDDALYTLNETGRRIWGQLGPGISVKLICERLSEEYDAPVDTIRNEVSALIRKLLDMKIVKKTDESK